MTSIEIPSSVWSIEDHAFSGCSSLTSIEIPSSVWWIEDYAFSGCSSLTSIEIPNSVTSIGESAFSYCSSLTSIEIPNSVTSIGAYAFSSHLASITCFASTPPTCSNAFSEVDKSIPVYVPYNTASAYQSADYWSEFTNIQELEPIVIEDNGIYYKLNYPQVGEATVTYKGDSYDAYHNEYTGEVRIPETISYNNTTYTVTAIEDLAISYCPDLTFLEIPRTITNIGYAAFLTTEAIALKKSLLNSIYVNEDNPKYCTVNGILYNKELTELICYPGGKTGIFEVPSCVEEIASCAFGGSNLTKVIIPNGVTKISNSAFICSLISEIEVPESVTYIDIFAFASCKNLTEIDLSFVQIPYIKFETFQYCTALEKVKLPSSITILDTGTFRGCSSLTNIEIPNTVAIIGTSAFVGCTALSSITCLASTPPTCETGVFEDVDKSIPVYVPNNTASAYRAAAEWSKFNNIIEMAPDYDVELTISSAGYATLYSAKALQLPEGVSAYYGKMSADNEWLNLYKLSEGKIPANTGVVLHGAEDTYGAWYLDEAPAAISGNALFGYTQDIPTSVITSIGFDVYTLAKEDDVVGFYKYNGETLKAGKAFLRLDRSIAQAPKMRIMDSETGIAEIEREPSAVVPVIYDLQGRRVSDMSRKGIYVVEGKKMIVK